MPKINSSNTYLNSHIGDLPAVDDNFDPMTDPEVQKMIGRFEEASKRWASRNGDIEFYDLVKDRIHQMSAASSKEVELRRIVNTIMYGNNIQDMFLSEVMKSGKGEPSQKTVKKIAALECAIEFFKEQLTPRLTPRKANNLDILTYEKARKEIDKHIAPNPDFCVIGGDEKNNRLFVVNFDGTGMDSESDPKECSNVARIHKAIHDLRLYSVHSEYIEGPGTQQGMWSRLTDSISGSSALARVEVMYDALCKQTLRWRTDDPDCKVAVVAVGFSRGAVEASLFNKLVEERGIHNPNHSRLENTVINQDPRIFAKSKHSRIYDVIKQKQPAISDCNKREYIYKNINLIPAGDVKLAYLGFDPVATGLLETVDRALPHSVKAALQISAEDEKRRDFPVNVIVEPQKDISNIRNSFLNVKVAGSHSDVGGAYRDKPGLGYLSFNLASNFFRNLTGGSLFNPINVNHDECVVHDSNGIGFQLIAMFRGRWPIASRKSINGKLYSTGGKFLSTMPNAIAGFPSNKLPQDLVSEFRPEFKVAHSIPVLCKNYKDNVALQCLAAIRRLNAESEFQAWRHCNNGMLPSGSVQSLASLAQDVAKSAINAGLSRVDNVYLRGNYLMVVQYGNRSGTIEHEIKLG